MGKKDGGPSLEDRMADLIEQLGLVKGMLSGSVEVADQMAPFLKCLPALSMWLDRDGRISSIQVSDGGLLKEDIDGPVTGRTMEEVLSARMFEPLMPVVERVRTTGVPVDTHITVSHRGGARGHDAFIIPFGSGAMFIAVRDVDELRRVEDTLRERQVAFEKACGAVTEGVFILDENPNYVYINPACGRIVGLEPGDWIGKRAGLAIHPDDMEKTLSNFLSALSGAESNFDTKLRGADGRYRDLNITLMPLVWKGRPHILGVVREMDGEGGA